jgi:hypothetical protein
MDNAERKMTTGRPIVEPLEDENYVYINDFVIPKGKTKEDIKAREEVTKSMYACWCAENPSKKRRNTDLKSEIEVNTESMGKITSNTGSNYKSALAFYYLDFILENAKKVKTSQAESNRQKKLVKGGYMLEMKLDNFDFDFFKEIKLMVGVKRNKDKVVYSITAVEVEK